MFTLDNMQRKGNLLVNRCFFFEPSKTMVYVRTLICNLYSPSLSYGSTSISSTCMVARELKVQTLPHLGLGR